MDFVIEKFFALYHYLILPGIGNFKTGAASAQLDFINRTIASAKSRIVFNTVSQSPTQEFYNFIESELQTNAANAANAFEDYTKELQQQLNNNNSIHFKTIGTITRHQNDVLTFQPENLPNYCPELIAERVIRKNATHTVLVGEQEKSSEEMQAALSEPIVIKRERWWIAASILAFIGVAAIVFYYASH